MTESIKAKDSNLYERIPVVEEQIKVINHRIGDLEGFTSPNN